jgi:mitogen-activated protein kinase kinase kinase
MTLHTSKHQHYARNAASICVFEQSSPLIFDLRVAFFFQLSTYLPVLVSTGKPHLPHRHSRWWGRTIYPPLALAPTSPAQAVNLEYLRRLCCLSTRPLNRSPIMDSADTILNAPDSDGSGSGDEYSSPPAYIVRSASDLDELEGQPTPTASSPQSLGGSIGTLSSGYAPTWSSSRSTGRPRGSSLVNTPVFENLTIADGVSVPDRDLRLQRPSAPARTPSNTYAPQRRPPHFINLQNDGRRSSSTKRNARRDPNAQYRAQEKAYVQRLRANPQAWYQQFGDFQGVNTIDSDVDDPSPSSEVPFEDDQYDPDIQLFLAENDNQPSPEELKNPKNQERLEWHAMLASVLKGDVVRQEKQRLIGSTETGRSPAMNSEIWLGVRAKTCGRSILLQKKLIEDARAGLGPVIEDIINFEIKGEKEVGKSAIEQVEDIVAKLSQCEYLYPTRKDMEVANPRAASDPFHESCAAVCAWHNTTQLINTELSILQNWVGNGELDFTKPRNRLTSADLSDDGSFLDRIMKEDGLKTLQGEPNMIIDIGEVINKAKSTLIENAEAFSKRHLPPYIEELLTLINFPTRLIQEIIRVRLLYAKKMKDPAQQSPILVDQMISQFQIMMKVAVEIKHRYLVISKPEPGWDLPPCIDDNFDVVVVDAMKYYFRLLNWKLNANKNTFKEAEILEQEWDFSNEIGRQLQNGDIEVAEQFR